MIKENDSVEFTNDFVYSTLLFDAKLIRQVIKIGKGSRGTVAFAHKHGKKVFYAVHIKKPKNFEIINISRDGKFRKTKKFSKLCADIAQEDLKKTVKIIPSLSKKA